MLCRLYSYMPQCAAYKCSISHVVGFLKGKSAILLHREFPSQRRSGKHFGIRGYYVSTVGIDKKKV